jgi:hypothetical protein
VRFQRELELPCRADHLVHAVFAHATDLREFVWVRSRDVANGSVARLLDRTEANAAVRCLTKSRDRHRGKLPRHNLIARMFVGVSCCGPPVLRD